FVEGYILNRSVLIDHDGHSWRWPLLRRASPGEAKPLGFSRPFGVSLAAWLCLPQCASPRPSSAPWLCPHLSRANKRTKRFSGSIEQLIAAWNLLDVHGGVARAFKEARRKSNKSSQGSIASSHSPATYRNATSHPANSIPKHHANDNCHGNRRG